MRIARLIFVGVFTLSVTACAGLGSKTRTVSSVYDYLYPETAEVVEKPGLPVLHVPITVGIAFVPQTQATGSANFWTGSRIEASLPEARKQALLDEVAGNFRKYDFVKSIEVIPSAYLQPQGSFANLEQVRTMYGVDVMALVSYDQVQFTDEDFASFAYWTIVGAYVVSGEKNETSTMVDTAVYDIASRRMLFRAPGISQVKSSATPVNLTEELRKNSVSGFEMATRDMVVNLDAQLQAFREKVRQQPDQFTVVKSPGYEGGGGGADLVVLLSLLLAGAWRRRAEVFHSRETARTQVHRPR